jgi:hypothetical protein
LHSENLHDVSYSAGIIQVIQIEKDEMVVHGMHTGEDKCMQNSAGETWKDHLALMSGYYYNGSWKKQDGTVWAGCMYMYIYHSLNAVVALSKNCPFWANTMIDLKNVNSTPYSNIV